MELTAKVPGSCGEIVQGTRGGVPYLVTCPINLYTKVTVTDKNADCVGLGVKSRTALKRTLHYLGREEFPFGIRLDSELPIGKGMASSSADIAAVCFAVAEALGAHLTAPEVSRIAAGIEPTDGVFFAGIIRINQMTGECIETLPDFPRLKIAVFDMGGAIDTLTFHKRGDLTAISVKNEPRTDEALRLLRENTAAKWAQAATESALANQLILPKNDLPAIVETALELGALGVNAAHSGTVIGVLFDPAADSDVIDEAVMELSRRYRHIRYLETVALTAGGCYLENRG